MFKGIFTAAALAMTVVVAQAQDSEVSWQHQSAGGVNFSQVALKGGEEALNWTLNINGNSAREMEKISWNNTYKLAFGQTKLGDQGVRKTDDKIDLETVLTYKLGTMINPYFGATFKSQSASGYQHGALGKVGVSQF